MTLTPGNWKILSSILAWGVLRLGISLQQDLPTKRTKWRPEERRKEFLKKPECPERQRVLQAWTVEGNEGNLQNQLHGVFVHWGSGGGMHIAFFLGSCDVWPWKVHLLGPARKKSLAVLCYYLFWLCSQWKAVLVAPDTVWLRETRNLVRAITTSSLVGFGSRMV